MREGVIIFAQIKGGGFKTTGDLQGGDASGIGLQGEGDQIIQHRQIGDETGVLRFLDAGLRFGHGGPLFAERELFFHIAHRVEVLIELFLIALAEGFFEVFGVAIHGVEDAAVEGDLIVSAGAEGGIVRDKELAEQFARAGDGWHAGAAAGPGHEAAAVNAIFGADGEGGESGRSADGFGGTLVDGDIAIGHALGVHGADAAEVGMDGKVAAFVAVVEALEEGEIVLMWGQRV